MMADSPTLFPHRRNGDGSYDSICPTCFATVARSKAEGGLAENETAHTRLSVNDCSPILCLAKIPSAFDFSRFPFWRRVGGTGES
jgi:hypothetical protein